MRRPKGALLPPLRTSRPRRRDVYGALRAAILEGVLAPNERLPSSRQAAAEYGVSRGLVEEVFGQLEDEGFVERAVGRGTYVAGAVSRLQRPAKAGARPRRVPAASIRGRLIAANAACREPVQLRPFNAGIADTREFPWAKWQRLLARAARDLGARSMNFADPRGLPELRAAIARYLAQFRGIRCTSTNVVIFNSAQQALNAMAILLLDKDDVAWLEDPCYLGARAALSLAGAAPVPVPVDDAGMRVEVGQRRWPRARLAYCTPSHQYPLGVSLSLERRFALLEWASRNQSWVVEDDYDGEFRFNGQPVTALYSLDKQARVLHLGTLNKVMFVALRIAYAVVPEELVEPLANIRTQLDGFTSPVAQMATSLFLDEGHFASHLRRMRTVYAEKRAALIEELAPLQARGWTWASNPAGMHLVVRHARGEHVRAIAAATPLVLALVSSYRAASAADDGVMLRYGALDVPSIRAGARTLVSEASKRR